MVKNTCGGNKHKGQARKFSINNSKESKKLRVSEDEYEIYAQVTKMLGNGMCHVITIKGKTLLCIIRGKFRGRGKRDNSIKTGSWVLIGLREWEEVKESASSLLNKCDLLEVYSDIDKEKLKSSVKEDWKLFISNDCNNSFTDSKQEDLFSFVSENQEEYSNLMSEVNENSKNTIKLDMDEGEIDIDEI